MVSVLDALVNRALSLPLPDELDRCGPIVS
jgi:hypothetical protein